MTDKQDQEKAKIGQSQFADAMAAFKRLREEITLTASEVTRGEFSQSGSGGAGIAFRKTKEVPDDHMDDIWGEILSLCDQLWKADHIIASIVLIETSSNTFFIPEQMEARVSKSIADAKDLKIIRNAEKAFEEGDDQKAVRMAAELKTTIKAQYNEELNVKIQSRQRTRKAALWIGGVSFTSLVVVAGIGIASLIEFLEQPPRPELPKFEETQRIFNDFFEEEAQVSKPVDNNLLPQEPQKPVIAPRPITPEPLIAPQQSEHKPEILPVEPAPSEASASASVFGSEIRSSDIKPEIKTTIPTATATEAVQSTPLPVKPGPKEVKLAEREDCVMGYAVVQKAAGLIQAQEDPAAAKKKVANFMDALQSACKALNLDPMTISLETGLLDQEKVETIARNILILE